MKFKKNDKITLDENETIKIIDLLGCGGQGEVYLAEYNGKQCALKVYKEKIQGSEKDEKSFYALLDSILFSA